MEKPDHSATTQRLLFLLGAISASLAVALGAFGAHSIKSVVSTDMLAVFETGVRYQMYHAFGMLITALAYTHWGQKGTRGFLAAAWCFGLGTIFFSGSLYLLSFSGERWIGAITPIGGILFIGGWLALGYSAWKNL